MKKVIILEGPDGGGKTMLAARLRAEHDYNVVKTGPPAADGDVTTAYLNALYAALHNPGRTVFDRLHLGEAIYGPLLRGIDRMGADGLALIEQTIADNDAALVICCPPWNTLVKGWSGKDDLLKTKDTLLHVRNRYMEEALRLGVEVYDWTASNAEEKLWRMIDAR